MKTLKKLISLLSGIAVLFTMVNTIPVMQADAADVSSMGLAESTWNFIKSMEGCDLQCFWDVAQWTIGYGNKCPYSHSTKGTKWGQKGGHTITESYARELFNSQITGYINTLKSNCKGLSMNQNQFDALLSATYNHGNVNDCPLKYYLMGQLTESEAREKYYVWHINPGTNTEKTLRARRKSEADLFFSGSPNVILPGTADNSYNVPANVTAGHKITTYNDQGSAESGHYIDPGDKCYVEAVYTNGFAKVKYPTSKGDRWAYAKASDFSLERKQTNHLPKLCVDSVKGGVGTITISGWAFDEDNRSKSLDIHVYMDSDNKWVGATTCKYDDEDALKAVVGQASCYKHRFAATFVTDQTGAHKINIAALDDNGGTAAWSGHDVNITADTTAPTVSNIKITDITPESFGVICNASDNIGIKSVKVAVWTDKNGQDDLKWSDMTNCGDHWAYTVKRSDHGNENGKYVLHVYAYDIAGNYKAGVTEYVPETTAPVIKNVYVTEMSASGYTVHCTATDNAGISKVQFPTWTDKNGQDDLLWRDGTKNGNEYVFRVNAADHKNETGSYITHIYAYDTTGNYSSYGISVNVQNDKVNPVLSNITISDVSSKGYTLSCTASDNAGISRVQFPTWTEKNGQNDLKWGFGTYNGGRWTYRVNVSDYKGVSGKYFTHVYAFDNADNYDVKGIEIIPKDAYTVTLNANGGKCDKASVNIAYGAKFSNLPVPSRSGYKFSGWFTKTSGGTQVTADSKLTSPADTTLFAQWTQIVTTTTTKATTTTTKATTKTTTTTTKATTKTTPATTKATAKTTTAATTKTTVKTTTTTKVTTNTTTAATTKTIDTTTTTTAKTDIEPVTTTTEKYISVIFGTNTVKTTDSKITETVPVTTTTVTTETTAVKTTDSDAAETTSVIAVTETTNTISETTMSEVTAAAPNITIIIIINGDLNGDQKFDVSDYVSIQKYLTHIGVLSTNQLKAADMNKDGKVDVFDAILMKRALMKQ